MKSPILITWLAVLGLSLVVGCQDDYDPIGNNKPATKLRVPTRHLSFDGTGGTSTVDVVTNAPEIRINSAPEWVASASLTDDNTKLTIEVAGNEASDEIRTGSIELTTVTGQTESSIRLQLVQAGKGGAIGFDPFDRDVLGPDWTATSTSDVKIGAGQVTVTGAPNGIGNSLYFLNPKGLVAQQNGGVGNTVTAYVDIKTGPGIEGGLKAYHDPATGGEFKFFFTMNGEQNGAFYAFRHSGGQDNPLALGDAIPGPGMPPVPPVGERDEYMRITFTNVTTAPFWWQSEVNIYSLQTRNGETNVLEKHFSRKFEIDMPKPEPGYFGLWGRFGDVVFRNFTLSAQQH